MRMTPTQVAAFLFQELLTRQQKPVPDWLLTVVNEDRFTLIEDMRRTAPTLKETLDAMEEKERTTMLDSWPRLDLWYKLYTEFQDVDVAELTGRMERPLDALLEEKGIWP